jgi:predicted phosphodiesterase
VRQCEVAVLKALSPLFSATTAVAVAGNHGRSAPKVLTTPEDNADLIAFEGVAEVLTESGAADTYGISFIAPDSRSLALVETSGTNLLVSHGDAVSGSAEKVKSWWHKTAFTRWGDADLGDILVTGHRHHVRVEEVAEDRWFIVCPTLGPESRWFGDIGGGTSLPGTLTFRTADRQWWSMNNLRP